MFTVAYVCCNIGYWEQHDSSSNVSVKVMSCACALCVPTLSVCQTLAPSALHAAREKDDLYNTVTVNIRSSQQLIPAG